MTERIILAGIIALALAGCGPSKKQKLATFRQHCTQTEFTPAQCALLTEMYAASIEATASADMAADFTAVGIATRR